MGNEQHGGPSQQLSEKLTTIEDKKQARSKHPEKDEKEGSRIKKLYEGLPLEEEAKYHHRLTEGIGSIRTT